jgi:hypothetical protein
MTTLQTPAATWDFHRQASALRPETRATPERFPAQETAARSIALRHA